ncbi:recombinase family protein [Nocardia sp. NPDC059180]|uniref:recombinase family protein n=1 Tax=Nocardia sp. NPDC059180 TaxID=3346761 RepID=UPI00369B99C9
MVNNQDQRRAVVYARVSKDRDGRSTSVNDQVMDCRAVVAQHGWELGKVIRDEGLSASSYATKDRPGYRMLLDELRSGDALVVWEPSRATRKLSDWVELRDLCAARGVLLVAGGNVYDLTRPSDRLSTGISAVTAEHESDRTRERIQREKRYAAERGAALTGLGFGWVRVFDPDGRSRWEVDPVAGPAIREAVASILAGRSLASVVRDWNARGVVRPSGQAWNIAKARQSLLRASLAGLRTHQGIVTGPGALWPAIITTDEHRALTALLTDPARLHHDAGGPRARHLLSGIAVCGECGEKVALRAQGAAYACRTGHSYRAKKQQTDDHVVREVLRALSDWRADTFLFDVVEDEHGESVVGGVPDESLSARVELATLRKRLEDAASSYAAGELSAAMLSRVEKGLLTQISEAEKRAVPKTVHPLLAAISKDPAALWQSLSLDEKRTVVKLTVRVTILATGRRGKGFDPESVVVERILTDRTALTAALT